MNHECNGSSETDDDSPFLSAILSAVGLAEAEASATADPQGSRHELWFTTGNDKS